MHEAHSVVKFSATLRDKLISEPVMFRALFDRRMIRRVSPQYLSCKQPFLSEEKSSLSNAYRDLNFPGRGDTEPEYPYAQFRRRIKLIS